MNDTGSTPATVRLAPDAEGLARAASLLRNGRLVAFPTETVYGLGADAASAASVALIYDAKGRPRFNPLIAHVSSLDQARGEGVFDALASRLAEAFWPGALTLVVPASEACTVCDLARAGLPTLALRVPAHPLARDLIARVGRPLAAPSANRSGHVSPTSAAHVLADLDGRIDAVLDGGAAPVGVESTVLACLGGVVRLLRPGGVGREAIEAVLGRPLLGPEVDPARPASPGLLASHYAPRARVRLDAGRIEPGEAALLFGPGRPPGVEHASLALNLSPSGDLAEAAANLFSHLRRLDAGGAAVIAAAPVPAHGLGEAINDRLARAAAGR